MAGNILYVAFLLMTLIALFLDNYVMAIVVLLAAGVFRIDDIYQEIKGWE